ncbi:ubiquinol cytochrome C oxidoreductase [Flavobacteriaceae bacterium AU392]|nr:ubiquinol cytochrome C oxidoreductase [Flavobacteriaceae bacterium]RKM81393.1 ubiquinol cytochrome C oxidoreductase [Flavobacteriaceae bacterium AU392]
MKTPIAVRSRNNIFGILSLIIGFTFLTTWLPLLRALFDGESYSWGMGYFGLSFSGKGLTSDYLILIVFLILYIALFASFNWIKNRVIFYLLLFWWWLHSFGNLLYDIIKNGDSMFHGDTLNIHVSISAIVIPLSIIALGLIIFIIKKDKQLQEVHIAWSRSNNIKVLIILGPLVLQGVFFAIGEPHGITDQIGVFIAIIQCFVIWLIFKPSRIE